MWRKRAFDPLDDQIGFMADVDTDTDGPHALGTINSLRLQERRKREEGQAFHKQAGNNTKQKPSSWQSHKILA
ncbi:hypothetical protein N7530_010798 [Penicillium desertorum]|uniref:Uncharacterized protein n=1 Tax=Penicillium desertorum TaxID=1303715 RepID=A0A9X0BGV3_9EURO|nr:hypothetical protein N7530_010798 [Penicillium desertorum]